MDPTTGIIYHFEDNPPPENDIKLRDRLQEFNDPEADGTKMSQNHANYAENEPLVKKWIGGFGLNDTTLCTPTSTSTAL